MFLGHEVFIKTYEADNRVHKSKPIFNMCVYVCVCIYMCIYIYIHIHIYIYMYTHTHTNIQAPEEDKSSPQHKNPFKDIYTCARTLIHSVYRGL